MKKFFGFLTSNASLVVVSAAILAFIWPVLTSWVSGSTQTVILGLIMLTMGLTLTPADLKILVSRPLDIAIGALAQYTLMPLIAWTLTRCFGLSPALAIGIVLVGCCPGGVSSNIMSYLCRGDVAFSVGMTTISTLISPVVTPLLVLLLVGETVDVDAWGMFKSILIVTLLPVSLGFGLRSWCSKIKGFDSIMAVMPSLSVVCLALIVGGVVSTVHDSLMAGGFGLFLLTFAVVLCHNSLGYLLGFLLGTVLKFSPAKRKTLSIEVGMQNAGLATNLSSQFFMAVHPLAVVPCAISCVWHSISGTLLASLFNKLEKRSGVSQ